MKNANRQALKKILYPNEISSASRPVPHADVPDEATKFFATFVTDRSSDNDEEDYEPEELSLVTRNDGTKQNSTTMFVICKCQGKRRRFQLHDSGKWDGQRMARAFLIFADELTT